MAPTKKKPRGKKKLSAEERKQRRVQQGHAKLIRDAFRASGFQPVPGVADKEFTFQGITSDFDDAFVYENVVVLVEYTIRQQSDVSEHIKKKKVLYDRIYEIPSEFLKFFRSKFTGLDAALDQNYHPHQFRIKILYCSLNAVNSDTKDQIPSATYYDYNVARYFDIVSKTVRKSARYELLDFLGLQGKDVGQGVMSRMAQTQTYNCSILPETHSNFGVGFKVVSFYIDPQSLLTKAYVLRKFGWRAGSTVYQRMISRAKIASVRRYLTDQRRVFINNIIVTLPDDTKLIDINGDTIQPKLIEDTQPGRIQLPDRFNSIGLVDGQHRVFSYHEGGINESEISKLRVQQNLLVTGIVFPQNMSEQDRLKLEAKLFLEINSNQTNARSDLKQEINVIIKPFNSESIAKRVVNHLNDVAGPLRDAFERFFFDTDKLKTTSVVSFATRPLINPHSEKSLFSFWNEPSKCDVKNETDSALLADYVQFCAAEINHIFAGVRASVESERWTSDRKQPKRFLTTVNVNGVISCLRKIVAQGKTYNVEQYRARFKSLKDFDFEKYRSSQYNKMGEELYLQYFD